MNHGTCAIPWCSKPIRTCGWCNGHYLRWLRHGDPLASKPRHPPHLLGRLADKFLVGDDCWIWTGARDPLGYGRVRGDSERTVLAHRLLYELLVGPIPEGLELDHLCRNPSCVRPSHLEPVAHRENLVRGAGVSAINAHKTHCVHGHEFTLENTYVTSQGFRQCRTCNQARARKRRVGAA